jgi:putative SOS response-associated peptidase YedK
MKVTRNSPISSTGKTATPSSWLLPFERGDETEGFLMVTAAAAQELVDIHDRHRSLWFLKLRANG